ncbi:MAG: hypothetical protein QOF96_1311, partial [Actinomycetota bacterium]|nr:hypothetical protein [Actinomycetota bacterium]
VSVPDAADPGADQVLDAVGREATG